MKGLTRTITVAEVFGAAIKVHWSSVLAVIWFVALALDIGHRGATLVQSVFLLLVSTLSLVAHELGHVYVAKQFGIRTIEVTLLPIGALSRLERLPEQPRVDLLIAAAGPLVSIVLAILCAALARESGNWAAFAPSKIALGGIFVKLFWVNAFIAALNLLPALPMDGGRIVKSLAEILFDERVAALVAIATGAMGALGFVFLAAVVGGMLAIFSPIVAFGAYRQWQDFRARESLRPLSALEAASRTFECLSPHQELLPLIDEFFASAQRDFPVLGDEGELVGMVTREDFAKGLGGGQERRRVADIMRREYHFALAAEPLATAVERMKELKLAVLPVLQEDVLVGLLIQKDAAEAEDLRNSLQDIALNR